MFGNFSENKSSGNRELEQSFSSKLFHLTMKLFIKISQKPIKIIQLVDVKSSLAYLLMISDETIEETKHQIGEEPKKKQKKSLSLQIVFFNDALVCKLNFLIVFSKLFLYFFNIWVMTKICPRK